MICYPAWDNVDYIVMEKEERVNKVHNLEVVPLLVEEGSNITEDIAIVGNKVCVNNPTDQEATEIITVCDDASGHVEKEGLCFTSSLMPVGNKMVRTNPTG